jgi:hypothetical protein
MSLVADAAIVARRLASTPSYTLGVVLCRRNQPVAEIVPNTQPICKSNEIYDFQPKHIAPVATIESPLRHR